MTRRRRNYSAEFKREAVGLVVDQGYSKAEAGRSLDIRPELIRRWVGEFEAAGGNAFPGTGKLTPDQQRIGELEAENRRLKMEKEILKKASASFAKEMQ